MKTEKSSHNNSKRPPPFVLSRQSFKNLFKNSSCFISTKMKLGGNLMNQYRHFSLFFCSICLFLFLQILPHLFSRHVFQQCWTYLVFKQSLPREEAKVKVVAMGNAFFLGIETEQLTFEQEAKRAAKWRPTLQLMIDQSCQKHTMKCKYQTHKG